MQTVHFTDILQAAPAGCCFTTKNYSMQKELIILKISHGMNTLIDHPSMSGAHIACKSNIIIGLHDSLHIQRTAEGRVGAFLKGAILKDFDITHGGIMNPAHTTYFPDQPGDVIACCASQAAGAQTQAMMCVIRSSSHINTRGTWAYTSRLA